MIKRLTAVALLGLLLLAGTAAISAQQDPEIVDNECYTGGQWEGKCETEWHWECGWYLFHWLRPVDTVHRYMPEWCNWNTGVVEPVDPVLPLYPSAGCIYNGSHYDDYTDFNGGYALDLSSNVYNDADCTSYKTTWSVRLVYAPVGYDPDFLCNAAFGTASNGSPIGTIDLYRCL